MLNTFGKIISSVNKPTKFLEYQPHLGKFDDSQSHHIISGLSVVSKFFTKCIIKKTSISTDAYAAPQVNSSQNNLWFPFVRITLGMTFYQSSNI